MKILILEDNHERIVAFQAAARALSADIILWRNAHRMIAEMVQHMENAALISLDHDLIDDDGEDAGTGMDIVKELARHKPICPIILHTSNTLASCSMLNELTAAGWKASRVPPITMGVSWIEEDWMPAVRQINEKTRSNQASVSIDAHAS